MGKPNKQVLRKPLINIATSTEIFSTLQEKPKAKILKCILCTISTITVHFVIEIIETEQ